MEPKYDGWRILSGILDGVVQWTRAGNRVTQVPYIEHALRDRFPRGTIVDGEIVDLASARQWNRTQSILSKTAGEYRHRPTPEDPPLTYVLFDVLNIEGRDVRRLPLSQRRVLLEEMCDAIEHATDGQIVLIPTQPPTDEGMQALVEFGFEGVVCKRKDSTYRCGARNGGWAKIKPKETIDALCTGVYAPEPGSRYAPIVAGQPQPWAAGGLCFRVLHESGSVYEGRAAGMDDRLRRELWERPEEFVGCVLELVHWGVQDSGALRFPQVRRIRDKRDKAPEEPPVLAAATPGKPEQPKRELVEPVRPWMRNYAAMGSAKLLACVASLSECKGDAFEKCVQAGGDPAQHLAAAEQAARKKNLIQPGAARLLAGAERTQTHE